MFWSHARAHTHTHRAGAGSCQLFRRFRFYCFECPFNFFLFLTNFSCTCSRRFVSRLLTRYPPERAGGGGGGDTPRTTWTGTDHLPVYRSDTSSSSSNDQAVAAASSSSSSSSVASAADSQPRRVPGRS